MSRGELLFQASGGTAWYDLRVTNLFRGQPDDRLLLDAGSDSTLKVTLPVSKDTPVVKETDMFTQDMFIAKLKMVSAPTYQEENWLAQAETVVKGFSSLRKGWDGYSAVPPSENAIKRVVDFLPFLRMSNLRPTKIVASVPGGIELSFRRNGKYVAFEVLNSGSFLYQFDSEDVDEIGKVSAYSEEIHALMKRVAKFLG